MKSRIISVFLLLYGFSWISCENDLEDEPLPPASFPDFTFNVQLPAYNDLFTKNWIYINDIGVRGVIVYRTSVNNYVVFERNCSFSPFSAGATVEVDVSNLFMRDRSCGSTFNFPDGTPTGGPAISPLRIYESSLSGSFLTITDVSANGR